LKVKSHAKHVALGGVVVPVALALGAAIANGAQTALGLDLHGTALAIFLVGFVAGGAAVMHGQLKLETAKIANDLDLGKMLGGIDLGGLFGSSDDAEKPPPTSPASLSSPSAIIPPPPPPPPAP
jgi:hypothetical protein